MQRWVMIRVWINVAFFFFSFGHFYVVSGRSSSQHHTVHTFTDNLKRRRREKAVYQSRYCGTLPWWESLWCLRSSRIHITWRFEVTWAVSKCPLHLRVRHPCRLAQLSFVVVNWRPSLYQGQVHDRLLLWNGFWQMKTRWYLQCGRYAATRQIKLD